MVRHLVGICLGLQVFSFAQTTLANTNEIIIKLKKPNSSLSLPGAFNSLIAPKILKGSSNLVLAAIKVPADQNKLMSLLANNPSIEYVEPNYQLKLFDRIPNDQYFSKSWGLLNTGQEDSEGQVGIADSDIHILELWQQNKIGTGEIIVAVIDSGIELSHPDLTRNIFKNPGEMGELANNDQDDDGNGFVDDVHGWNFVADHNDPGDDADIGHGTHVAGIIGAEGNNRIGIAGVNWKVRLMPLKFIGSDGGGSTASAIEAIDYAVMMGAHVINASWGGEGNSKALYEAIERAKNAGVLFVAAAGNDGGSNDNSPVYPASYNLANIISVAASDNRDEIAYFSNYGKESVHIAAPGSGIYSTVPGHSYMSMSGTSMAAPHVAGVAALALQYNPSKRPLEIKKQILNSCDQLEQLTESVGCGGRINAYRAVMGRLVYDF